MEAEDGRFVAAVVNWEEASGGMIGSEPVVMAFNRFLRPCDNSSVADRIDGVSRTSICMSCSREPESFSFQISSASIGSFAACELLDDGSAREQKAAMTPFFTHPRSMEVFAEK